jgi:chaperonin GroES
MGGQTSDLPSIKFRVFGSVEVLSMDIRPLHDRVVVKRIEEGETMQGGLYIPDSAKEKPQQGEVVAVGKGKRTEDGKLLAMDVQVGDRILFGKYSGSDIKLNGTEYMIMREDEILGVFANGSSNGASAKK